MAGRRILGETILRSGDRLQVGAAVIEYRLLEPSGPVERTALLPAAATEGLPDPHGAPAGPAPSPGGPAAPSALEISADDLFVGVDEGARRELASPVVASAALAAVHSSGVTDRPSLDFSAPVDLPIPPHPEPAPPLPPPSPLPPQRRVSDATLSQFAFRDDAPNDPRPRPSAPEVRVRRAAPSLPHAAPGPGPAGFFRRLLAQLVDSVILLALNLLLLSPVFLVLLFREAFQSADLLRDWAFLGILAGCGLMILGANLWYVVGGWARNGRTPGKALLRLAVVPADSPAAGPGIGLKAAAVRLLGFGLSGALLGVGFLLVLFRKDRRALHDLLAGTRVVKTA